MSISYSEIRQLAVKTRRCWVCANPSCPYPTDEDYKAKAETDPSWQDNKDCWMPFAEDALLMREEALT